MGLGELAGVPFSPGPRLGGCGSPPDKPREAMPAA